MCNAYVHLIDKYLSKESLHEKFIINYMCAGLLYGQKFTRVLHIPALS